ncbi:MAG TPA: hypothetical protein VHE12_03170, partial [bacterium]|nr:hypothetical protein [bacterium]
FGSNEAHAALCVRIVPNEEGLSWQQEMEELTKPVTDRVITYKVTKEHLLVFSGFRGKEKDKVFYWKAIPVRVDDRRFTLLFTMWFPREKKGTFDPILEYCAKSFRPVTTGSHRVVLGWKETDGSQEMEQAVAEARAWMQANLQCGQYGKEKGWDDPLPSGPCTIEPEEPDIFDLSGSGQKQFILTAFGSIELVPYGNRCDQKFVLFTEMGGKLTHQVLGWDNQEDTFNSYGAMKVLGFPDGRKALLFLIGQIGCQRNGHLFMEVQGVVRDVLDYLESDDPCRASQQVGAQGFDSVLELRDKSHLRLFKKNYETIDKDGVLGVPAKFHYSEVNYRFDKTQGIFIPDSPERELAKGPAEKEWNEAPRDVIRY